MIYCPILKKYVEQDKQCDTCVNYVAILDACNCEEKETEKQ
jgi:hypothetical protein